MGTPNTSNDGINATNINPRSGTSTRRSNNQVVLSNPTSYEGECEKIGDILALKVEKFNKKVSYEQFVEKITNYVTKKYIDGADIKLLLTEGKDPVKIYEEKNMTRSLTAEEQSDPVKDAILKEEIKQYVLRKNIIRRNIQATFSLVWGQCSSALQAYVKGQSGYQKASEDHDVKWLLKEVKKASSGIDSKANPYVTMHDAIGMLYQMRQGQNKVLKRIIYSACP